MRVRVHERWNGLVPRLVIWLDMPRRQARAIEEMQAEKKNLEYWSCSRKQLEKNKRFHLRRQSCRKRLE